MESKFGSRPANVGRKAFLNWVEGCAPGTSFAILFADDYHQNIFVEGYVFLDFLENQGISIIVREWLWWLEEQPKEPKYFLWRGSVPELTEVLRVSKDNFGHVAVINYVKANSQETFESLRSALKASEFSGFDTILKTGRVPRRRRYKPKLDLRQLRLF